MMAALSAYPQVCEWVYLGGTAVNLAQVASISFGQEDGHDYAIVRLASYTGQDDTGEKGVTWFRVTAPRTVEFLRGYIDRLLAPGCAAL